MKLKVAAILAVASLAGCLEGDQPAAIAYDVPALADVDVDAAALLAELQAFAGEFGERRENLPQHIGARDWMADQFDSYGLDVWRHNFTRGGLDQENIVGIQWGQVRDQWIVLGAHYDTTHVDCSASGAANRRVSETGQALPCAGHQGSDGAYDDGSGVLMTLHAAKALASVNSYYTIAYALFDGEERGLEGSGNFSAELVAGDTDFGPIEFRGMVNVDMFGINWPGTTSPIYFLNNNAVLQARVEALREEKGAAPEMVRYEEEISLGSTDFQRFVDLGVPTGFFGSDFNTWQIPGGVPVSVDGVFYPFWHIADTYETMLLMAGSQEALEAGFDNGADFIMAVTTTMMDPEIEL